MARSWIRSKRNRSPFLTADDETYWQKHGYLPGYRNLHPVRRNDQSKDAYEITDDGNRLLSWYIKLGRTVYHPWFPVNALRREWWIIKLCSINRNALNASPFDALIITGVDNLLYFSAHPCKTFTARKNQTISPLWKKGSHSFVFARYYGRAPWKKSVV